MLDIVLSNRFRKDLKLLAKRGCNLEKLNRIVDRIAAGEKLEQKHRVHELIGNYAGFMECQHRTGLAPDLPYRRFWKGVRGKPFP